MQQIVRYIREVSRGSYWKGKIVVILSGVGYTFRSRQNEVWIEIRKGSYFEHGESEIEDFHN